MKKLVKTFVSAMLVTVVALGAGLSGCKKPDDPYIPPPPIDIEDVDVSFDYYAHSPLAADKTIYVLNDGAGEGSEEGDTGSSYTYDQLMTASAVQGLYNRKEVSYFLNGLSVTSGINTDMYHLDYAAEKHGLTKVNLSLEDAIKRYIADWEANVAAGVWGSQINLATFNTVAGVDAYIEAAPKKGYETPGYILYRKNTISVNVASTVAAVTGFVPVERENEAWAQALGLKKKITVDSDALGYAWALRTLRNELSPKALINQNFSSGGKTNPFLKDYGIAHKYFFTYYDNNTNAPTSFRNDLHKNFLSKNVPVLGYPQNEVQDVAMFAEYGQFIVPTDYSYNLSFLGAKEFGQNTDGTKKMFSPNKADTTAADPSKHYVAFVFSDGDNATMWANTAQHANTWMSANGRAEDNFEVTWGITPSIADLMPSIYDSIITQTATEKDSFIVPVTGQGYTNLYEFKTANSAEYADYLSKLAVYLKKSGMDIVTAMSDGATTAQRIGTYEDLAQIGGLKGGLVYQGGAYFSGVNGGVYWATGKDAAGNTVRKPFIGPRDSLWETTPAYIAARINQYPIDIKSIDGYTIINVHPWSHNYQDVRKIVKMLNPNVEVVSMDRLVDMVIANVTPTDSATDYTTPALNGSSITETQLRANPSAIPVDPLQNDFLLWQENWTGVEYSNSDPAQSNVGAVFAGSVRIAVGGTGVKPDYTLPNEDNLHIWFNARGDSTDASKTAKLRAELTVDGVKKTVIVSASLKGVAGTGKPGVTGDGWQFFSVPVGQFFPDYKGKTAKLEITCLADSQMPVKVDMVTTQAIIASPNGAYNPLNNQFTNGNTEDWALGHVYMTSQYYYWGAVDKDTLKPFAGGAIQIDCSDGGGAEKRNGNSNMFMTKTYTLPEANDNVTINWEASTNAGENTGAKYKLTLNVDGHYFVLADWVIAGNSGVQSFDLTAAAAAAGISNLAGKTVTAVFEARDSARVDGAGEIVKFHSFVTVVG